MTQEKLLCIIICMTFFLTRDVYAKEKHGLLESKLKELFPVITIPVESVSKSSGISVGSVIVIALLIVLAVMLLGPFSLIFIIPLLLLLTAASLSAGGVKRSGRAMINKLRDRDGYQDISFSKLYNDKLITGLLLAKIDGYMNDFKISMMNQ